MLAQRSPRYICYTCRVCLASRSLSARRCRQLSQAAGQTPASTDNNIPQIPPPSKGPGTPRRRPLSELLAKLHKTKPKEVTEKSERSAHEKATTTAQHTVQNRPVAAIKDGIQKLERSEGNYESPASPQRNLSKTFPETKVGPRRKPTEPPAPPSSDGSILRRPKRTNLPSPARPMPKKPTSLPKPETAQSEDGSITLPIISRRTKQLELPDTPMPSAPQTRLRSKAAKLVRSEKVSYKVTHPVQESQQHPDDPANKVPLFPGSAARKVIREVMKGAGKGSKKGKSLRPSPSERISAKDIQMKPIEPKEHRPVPTLEHGLDRVLFNPGVMYLRDPRSLVYNFDPYLENIMPIQEFDYDALMEYITSSRDRTLVDMAREQGAKFVGSTSSMTACLSHFHFLISAWRPINTEMLSGGYVSQYKSYAAMTRAPAGIFLRYKGDGIYAIDADKMYDTDETVLQWLGRSMEKMLTLPPEQMEKFRKTESHTLAPHERGQPEAYHYTLSGEMLMRSQLDCNDARLPGTGVFDLKTRACIAVRMNVHDYEVGADYEIQSRTGIYNSFEREYYDMIRAAFLKYSLQVRIGNMDGIFVAYHNTRRIFGFQYISLEEMDLAIHGNTEIGNQEFHFSIRLLNEALSRAVQQFPEKSLRLIFEARDTNVPQMYIFAEPYEEHEIDAIQNGEYFQALKVAEARSRAEKEAKAAKALAEPQQYEADTAESTNAETVSTEQSRCPDNIEPTELSASIETDQLNSETEGPCGDKGTSAETISETPSTEQQPSEFRESGAISASQTSPPDTKEAVSVPDPVMPDRETDASNESDENKSAIDDVEVEPEPEPSQVPPREILAMALKVQNYINGHQISVSPTPGPEDTWEISYTFERYPNDRAMRLFLMCSDRRRKAHDDEFRDQVVGEGLPADKVSAAKIKAKEWSSGFLSHLRDLSLRGKKWRREFNEKFGDREKVVWKGGRPPSKFEEMTWKEGDGKGS